jgi:hypothetical protein
MEIDVSLPRSEELSTCPYSEPDQSSQYFPPPPIEYP